MAKIIFATHHKMAEGLKDTLEYIAPGLVDIIALSAYLDNKPIEEEIVEVLEKVKSDTPIIVFTDLLGGSVNQEFAKRITEYDFHLITGVNLPVALTIAMQLSTGEVTADSIRAAIDEAKEQIVYVNDVLLTVGEDDE